MRPVIPALVVCAVLLVLTGCPPKPFLRPDQGERIPAETPTANQLAWEVNDNARRLQAVEARDLEISAKGGGQAIDLVDANMSCAKPRHFSLQATVVGHQAVDIGSNDQEFWFWLKQGDGYLYHCAYADLSRGNVRMPFPVHPEWVLEVMGMAEMNPDGKYEVKVSDRTLNLIETTTSPSGQPIRKVTVFNRAVGNSGRHQVVAHLLQDGAGNTVCAASVAQVHFDKASGAVVPQKFTIVCAGEKQSDRMEMTMTLGGLQVNPQFDRNQMAARFTRPRLPGVPTYDLARGPEMPVSRVQRTGGFGY
jgi:hypothetical protein